MEKRSKTLEKLAKKHADVIKEYIFDEDGHWLHLQPGYNIEGCSCCHGNTVRETLNDWELVESGEPY